MKSDASGWITDTTTNKFVQIIIYVHKYNLLEFGSIFQELIALGEVVGTESRGLSADNIATLPSVNYKRQSSQEGSSDP